LFFFPVYSFARVLVLYLIRNSVSDYVIVTPPVGKPWSQNPLEDNILVKVAVLKEACEALAALHKHGIVHRAICPDSICSQFSDPKKPIIVNMGFALLPGDAPDPIAAHPAPLYLAPETRGQFKATSAEEGARADVWAMGLTALSLLSNTDAARLIFQEKIDRIPRSIASVLAKWNTKELLDSNLFNLDEGVKHILERMLRVKVIGQFSDDETRCTAEQAAQMFGELIKLQKLDNFIADLDGSVGEPRAQLYHAIKKRGPSNLATLRKAMHFAKQALLAEGRPILRRSDTSASVLKIRDIFETRLHDRKRTDLKMFNGLMGKLHSSGFHVSVASLDLFKLLDVDGDNSVDHVHFFLLIELAFFVCVFCFLVTCFQITNILFDNPGRTFGGLSNFARSGFECN
jgi:serine/threonine protein kinase